MKKLCREADQWLVTDCKKVRLLDILNFWPQVSVEFDSEDGESSKEICNFADPSAAELRVIRTYRQVNIEDVNRKIGEFLSEQSLNTSTERKLKNFISAEFMTLLFGGSSYIFMSPFLGEE